MHCGVADTLSGLRVSRGVHIAIAKNHPKMLAQAIQLIERTVRGGA